MFDNFFERHKPENEVLPSSESAVRINSMLREKMNVIHSEEEKPMKIKRIKGILCVAAAAVITATALLFSATADYTGDDKYIVRINNKRVDADIVSYKEGRVELDVITYETPCELLITNDGKPVTEDSDIDRREVHYTLHVYASEDPDEQVWDPEKGVEMTSAGGGFFGMWTGDAMQILVPSETGGTNTLEHPAVVIKNYDEKKAKEFWENYRKNPEEEARKWAESCADLPPKEDLSMVEQLKKSINEHIETNSEHSIAPLTETEISKILEFLDENFGE